MMASEAGFDVAAFCRDCHVADVERFIERCCALYDVLVMTNKQYNLTRIDSPEGYWTKHVADSLAIAKYYPELAQKHLRMADIGCGAGFPALVLALAFPKLWIMAVDSTGKKIKFVQQAAAILELKNLRTTHGRAGELNRLEDWKEYYQVITARAVAPAAKIYGETANMLDPLDGRYILYKTPEHVQADLPEMTALTTAEGLSWGCSEEFELPNQAGRRQFLHSN
jgi:16S rRNA (guanine527-N7)-methyltransferase